MLLIRKTLIFSWKKLLAPIVIVLAFSCFWHFFCPAASAQEQPQPQGPIPAQQLLTDQMPQQGRPRRSEDLQDHRPPPHVDASGRIITPHPAPGQAGFPPHMQPPHARQKGRPAVDLTSLAATASELFPDLPHDPPPPPLPFPDALFPHQIQETPDYSPEQDIKFRQVSIDEGLSNSVVNVVFQDSSGFIWLGTQNGLNRYDGYKFTTFYTERSNPNSLSDNVINDIDEDEFGFLWIATDRGLNRFDPRTEKFTRHLTMEGEHRLHFRVMKIIPASGGILWLGTDYGLLRVDTRNMDYRVGYPLTQNAGAHLGGRISDLAIDSKGRLWFLDKTLLVRYTPSTREIQVVPVTVHPAGIDPRNYDMGRPVIDISDKGDIWFFSQGLLLRTTVNVSHYSQIEVAGPAAAPTSIFAHGDYVWLTTSNRGVMVYEKGVLKRNYNRDNSIDDGMVTNQLMSVFQDREGQYWIGTRGRGVLVYNPARNQFHHVEPTVGDGLGLNDSDVTDIYKDSKGIIWIATDGGGLNRYDRSDELWSYYGSGLGSPISIVNTICEKPAGTLWLGTINGVFAFNTSNGGYWKVGAGGVAENSTMSVSACLVDSKGVLWLGLRSNGLARLNDEGTAFEVFSVYESGSSIENEAILTLFEDLAGDLWVGTSNGLKRFDRNVKAFVSYLEDEKEVRNAMKVTAIAQRKEGELWIGTQGFGLYKFTPETGRHQVYSEQDGLFSNSISSILVDSRGLLWIGANKGLSRFNPETESFRNYDVSDGLQSNEFITNSVFKATDGEMFLGGNRGFNYFYPEQIIDNSYRPPVFVTDFLLFDKSIDPGDYSLIDKPVWMVSRNGESIRLNHKQNIIGFEFAALSYAAPYRNRYRYKLEPIESEWNYRTSEDRIARFTFLGPGEYTLRVQGTNNTGANNWSDREAVVKIIVVPPWWNTIIFKAVVAVLLAALVLGIFQLRTRTMQARARMLEKMVEERTEKLAAQTDELQKFNVELAAAKKHADVANAAKSEFLANMSHELRTPLNAILGYTQIFRNTPELMEKHGRAIDTVHNSGEHLLTLINDVLDLSKVEAGKVEVFPEDLGLNEFLEEIVAMTRIRADMGGVNLVFEPEGDLPAAVKADEKRLRQVLLNLLSNATKFTAQDGTVRFSVSRVEDQQLPPGNCRLRFSVADTGIGISEEDIEKIFQPFHQVREASMHTEGTGLGLSISTRIVKLMGGELEVESKPGEGSTFWFEAVFPLSFSTGKEARKAKIVRGYRGDRKRVLVVDDNANNREVVRAALEPLGFEIREAEDGTDALVAIPEFKPHIVLLDLVMKTLSGFDVVKEMRETPAWKSIPVVAISASSEKASRKKMQRRGFDDFLPKPIDIELLFEMVGNLLKIEWEYLGDDISVEEIEAEQAQEESATVVPPPAEAVKTLLDLAGSHSFSQIKRELEQLQENAQYKGFCAEARKYLDSFNFDALTEFLEKSITE